MKQSIAARMARLLAVPVLCWSTSDAALAAGDSGGTYVLIHRFQTQESAGGKPASNPESLAADADGNLYGTTINGGYSRQHGIQCGTVFRLVKPTLGAKWSFAVLHRTGGADDDCRVEGALNVQGDLIYGTNAYGAFGARGGSVFSLDRSGAAYTIIHRFSDGVSNPSQGYAPGPNVLIDSKRTLYGTTGLGGNADGGIAYKIFQPGDIYKVMHAFAFKRGAHPSNVLFGPDGAIYGTAEDGVVFRLTTDGQYSVLYSFYRPKRYPFQLEMTFGPDGKLYGVDPEGGSTGNGVAWSLAPGAPGQLWTLTNLHEFNAATGARPRSLVVDAAGNLYGTAQNGGLYAKANGSIGGTLFRLRPQTGSTWSFDVLHNFGDGSDGFAPNSLILNRGVLYGTTYYGGESATTLGGGIVFKFKP